MKITIIAMACMLTFSTALMAHADITTTTGGVYEGVVGDGYSPPIVSDDPVIVPPIEPIEPDGVYIAVVEDEDVVLSIHSQGDVYVLFVLNNDHIVFDTYVGRLAPSGFINFVTYDDYSSVQGILSLRFRPGGDIYGVQTACFEIFDSHACLFDNGTEFLGEKVF